MTGVGSPCGACKFLRRKCVNGCIFAPYFSHEQGAMHFAAIHKVFGASNVSKLLTHLPVADRCEAALTISYEARARLQDPIYGCVSHIYALQQQVANLQAQLALLRAQASHGPIINASGTTTMINGEFPMYPQGVQGLLHIDESNNTISAGLWQSYSANETEVTSYNDSGILTNNANNVADDFWSTLPHEESDPVFEDPTHGVASLGTRTSSRKWAFQDTHDELKSMAFAYIS